MKRKLFMAVALIVATITLSSCTKLWSLFEDKELIEELPTTFEVMRTYVGKYESDLDALLVRLGCTRLEEAVVHPDGWTLTYLVKQDFSHLTFYSYSDGIDEYCFALNSSNKSGKTFQVYWERLTDCNPEYGKTLMDKEMAYTKDKKLVTYDAKIISWDDEIESSFSSKEDFVSQVKANAEAFRAWGISSTYSRNEATMVLYSPVNFGASYANMMCLDKDDVDMDALMDMFSNVFSSKGE